MNLVWEIAAGTAALALLLFAWSGKNAVWGGATLGFLIGLIVAAFTGFAWWTVWKSVIIGTGAGLLVEIPVRVRHHRDHELPLFWRFYSEARKDRAIQKLKNEGAELQAKSLNMAKAKVAARARKNSAS